MSKSRGNRALQFVAGVGVIGASFLAGAEFEKGKAETNPEAVILQLETGQVLDILAGQVVDACIAERESQLDGVSTAAGDAEAAVDAANTANEACAEVNLGQPTEEAVAEALEAARTAFEAQVEIVRTDNEEGQ